MKKQILLLTILLINFVSLAQLAQNTPCTTHDICILNASSNLGPNNGYWFHSINTSNGAFSMELTSNKSLRYKFFGPFEIVDQDLCDSLAQSLDNLSIFTTSGQTVLTLTDSSAIGSFYILYVTNVANGNGAIININSINCIPFTLGATINSFYGYNKNEYNHIYFETSREFNLDYYTVEHSNDGIQWKATETVYPTNLDFNNYNVKHKSESVDNYYRISYIDFDGTKTIADEIIYIKNNRKNPIKRYNSFGQEVDEYQKGLIIYLYEDGTTEKVLR